MSAEFWNKVYFVLFAIILFILLGIFFGIIFSIAWNYSIAIVFGLPKISFISGIAFIILIAFIKTNSNKNFFDVIDKKK